MDDLTQKHCVPCEGGVDPFTPEEIEKYNSVLATPWDVVDHKKIKREFKFKDFKEALDFINKVGELAESENHHPDIFLHNYKKVDITLSTHAIGGLSGNDFILAAKIDKLL